MRQRRAHFGRMLEVMDLQSRVRWEQHTKAKQDMLARTNMPEAPWYVVEGNDKKRARLNWIAHFLSRPPRGAGTPRAPPRAELRGRTLPDGLYVPQRFLAQDVFLHAHKGVYRPCRQTAAETRVSQITFDDFLKVDIRAGRVIDVQPFPEARKPAWKLWIDFGAEIGVRKSSAQIVARYGAEALKGRMVLAVVNFPPRQIGPFRSEVLTLGLSGADGAVVLVAPDAEVPEGSRLH
jgi:tRNA-binding protein